MSILLAVVAALLLSIQVSRGWAFPFGFGKDPRHYPERALDFLWAQNIRGPIFNTDVWASALLWRGHGRRFPVFVDARLEAYPETFWKDKYYRVLQTVPGWEEVLEEYGVRCAMVRRQPGRTDDRIGDALWEHPDWGLVYWNDVVMIFVKRDSGSLRNDEVLASWEFRAFSPRRPQEVEGLPASSLPEAEQELAKLAAWEPKSFLPHWTWAVTLTGLGRGEEAVAQFDALAGRRDAKHNVAFARSRSNAELVAGYRERWAAYLAEAGGDPSSPDELFAAAALASRTGELNLSIDLYRDVLEARPGDTDAMNNLALVLARAGRVEEARGLIAEALRREPDDPYYVATRGEVHWHAGNRPAALADFQTALRALPADAAEAREEVMHWILRVE